MWGNAKKNDSKQENHVAATALYSSHRKSRLLFRLAFVSSQVAKRGSRKAGGERLEAIGIPHESHRCHHLLPEKQF